MSPRWRKRAASVFEVPNLGSPGCSMMVSKSLKRMTGVRDVEINYVTEHVYLSYDPQKVTPEQIKTTIEKAGHKVLK